MAAIHRQRRSNCIHQVDGQQRGAHGRRCRSRAAWRPRSRAARRLADMAVEGAGRIDDELDRAMPARSRACGTRPRPWASGRCCRCRRRGLRWPCCGPYSTGLECLPMHQDFLPPGIVVLTGAGISKESGIDTFRDKDGLWTRVNLEEVATHRGLAPRQEEGARLLQRDPQELPRRPYRAQCGAQGAGETRAEVRRRGHGGDPEHRSVARDGGVEERAAHARPRRRDPLHELQHGDGVRRAT